MLHDMTQRLQVLLDDTEFDEIRQTARRHRMTVAEWVRQALRVARRDEPSVDAARKLLVLRAATRHAFPSGDVEQLLDDIERGRFTDAAP